MANNNKGVSPITAGVVGAVVGAAVGATAVALSDEKNRKKIGKKFDEFKEEGQKAYSDLKGKMEEITSQAGDKVEEAKKSIKAKL
jgi:gas vesicle protein